MRIVFFGTSSFAIPSLDGIQCSSHTLLAVVTQPDAKGGRRHEFLPTPVKEWVVRKGSLLFQPPRLSEASFLSALQKLRPDLFVVVSYGKILPPSLLTLPPHGGINVHPSLLPRYRGASPIPWAILNGDEKTGVSIIALSEEVDGGEIFLQKTVSIGKEENALSLSERLSKEGGKLLVETLKNLEEGRAVSMPQKGEVRFAPRFKKEDGLVDWGKSAQKLSLQIRALLPWPGSYSYLHGKRVLFWKAKAEEGGPSGRPGEVVALSKEGIGVATGKGKLLLEELQLEGKEKMPGRLFLLGHPLRLGEGFTCNSGKS